MPLVPTRTANSQVTGRAVLAVQFLPKDLIVAVQPRTPASVRIALVLKTESVDNQFLLCRLVNNTT